MRTDEGVVSPMKVGLGSTNPVKLQATVEAFTLVQDEGEEIEVVKHDVNSGVSDQPTSDQEAILGSKNRAKEVKKKGGFDFNVGLEGSVSDTQFGMFLTGWSYMIDKDGDRYLGGGGRLELPKSVADRIREGEELGPIMDEITGQSEVKRGPGAIGIFTDGIITRKDAYRDAVVFALAKFIRPEMYEGG